MKTTTTIRPIPTRFVTLELDEREARDLIDALDSSDVFARSLQAQLEQALQAAEEAPQSIAPVSAPLVSSVPPKPAQPAEQRQKYGTTKPQVPCKHCGRLCDIRGHLKHERHCSQRPQEPVKPSTPVVLPQDLTSIAAPPVMMTVSPDLIACGCGRKYTTAGALQAHIARDHDGVEPSEAEIISLVPREPPRLPNREWAERPLTQQAGVRL